MLASQPANFLRLQALHVMENLLQSYVEIDAANRKALVVGFGGTIDAVDAVKAGKLLATGDNDGFL